MGQLVLTFQELYNRVSKFLGTYGSSGPSGDDLTDAKEIVNDAYRRFLDAREWSFLKREYQLITSNNTFIYQLPEDFATLIGTINYGADENYPPLEQRSINQIRKEKADNDWTSYPELFAIKSSHSKEFGQRWELILYPTPDAAYPLWFFYKIEPLKLEEDSDIPVGGSEFSGALRQLCLAEAESNRDEQAGIQEQKASIMLADAMRKDMIKAPHNLGYFGVDTLSARDIARGSILNRSVLFDGTDVKTFNV